MKKQAIGGQAVDADTLRAPLLLGPSMPFFGGPSIYPQYKSMNSHTNKTLELSSGESWNLSGILKMTLIHIGKSSSHSTFPRF
jgi:hypothetical protein